MKKPLDGIAVNGATIKFQMHHAACGDSLPETPGIFVLHGCTSNQESAVISIPGHADSLKFTWGKLPESLFMQEGVHWTVSYLEIEDPNDRARYYFDLYRGFMQNPSAA